MSRARGAGKALRGPGSRSASASRRRREKQQQVLRFSNPFQPLPLHQSAPPERARGRGSLLRWSRVPAAQAWPPTRATPGPALRRWGCAPGAPRLGRARAEDDGGSQALYAPFPFTLFPTPHPQPEPARPAGWAGGGEVGGEPCGALRQWGSLAEPRDAPGKVAKCRLCCSPGRRPREPALASSRGDRRGETRSKVVSGTRDWLAPSRVSYRPRLPVLCRRLHREEATHSRGRFVETLGVSPARERRGETMRNPEESDAQRAHGVGARGGRHLAAATSAQAQALKGAKLASLRDQLN